MNARLRMYKYCYSNEGAIYAKGLCRNALYLGSLNSNDLPRHNGVRFGSRAILISG